MPVKSSNSSIIKWPDRETVESALRDWVAAQDRPELLKAGFIGSYARGGWGVGSDLDVILIVSSSDRPFFERPLDWDTGSIPVAVDLIIYTQAEWDELKLREERFSLTVETEAVWIKGIP